MPLIPRTMPPTPPEREEIFPVPLEEAAPDPKTWRDWLEAAFGLSVIGMLFFVGIWTVLAYPESWGWGLPWLGLATAWCAALVCIWYHTDYCPFCGSSVWGRQTRWCSSCWRIIKPETLQPEGGTLVLNCHDRECDPSPGLLRMYLLIAVNDHVDSLSFVPTADDYHLRFERGGIVYEAEPPPWQIHRNVIAVARAMFAGSSEQHGPARGGLEVVTDRGRATATAEIEPTDAGDVLRIGFDYHELVEPES